MSTLKVNTLTDTAATKSVPIEDVVNGTARAWVNFNGTGTVAIRAQYNVSSVTDNGTGDYTINFTNAMPDANYSVCGSSGDWTTAQALRGVVVSSTTAPTTSALRINTKTDSGNADSSRVSVAIFR